MFEYDEKSNLQAKFEAQKIAFAPFVFQAAISLRDMGILEYLKKRGKHGATPQEVSESLDVSLYAAKVLMEAGMASEMLHRKDDKYILSKVGYFILRDTMTRVNMDFTQDVCYKPLFHLEASLREGRAAGLAEFGDWPTVYEALAHLPEKAQRSWFAFDHFYSDDVFGKLLPIVFEHEPKTLMDIGGNTGKWTLACMNHSADVNVTILDLPGQLAKAQANVEEQGFTDRVNLHPINVLNPEEPFPRPFDAIWMSQFLVCFSEEEIVSILTRARQSMDEGSRLYILDTYWDRQAYEAAAYCLINTSLYFTCVANGNSKMYHSDDLKGCIEKAGLTLAKETDDIGVSHTLFECRRA